MRHLRERADHVVHAFVLLQTSQISKRGNWETGIGNGRVGGGIDARMDHRDILARDAAGHEIVSGAVADGFERNIAVDASQWTLREPDRRGERRRQLEKGGRAKKMRDDRGGAPAGPQGRVERNLVDVLDQQIPWRAGERAPIVLMRERAERRPGPDAMDVHTIDAGTTLGARPSAAEKGDVMSAARQTAEDLVQMDLGAPALRVFDVLPVDEQKPHYRRPILRASASSTPFTKRALSGVP